MRRHWAFAVVVMGFVVGTIAGLDRLPLSHHDEALYAARACLHGFAPALGRPLFGDADEANWNRPTLSASIMAGGYRLIGFGIWQHRAIGVVAALVALVAVYAMALVMGAAPNWAALGVLLVAGQDYFHKHARYGRCVDMLAAMFACLGTLLVLCALRQREGVRRAVLLLSAGVFFSMGVGCHPLGIPLVCAGGGLVLTAGLPWRGCLRGLLLVGALPAVTTFGGMSAKTAWAQGEAVTSQRSDQFPPLFPLRKAVAGEIGRHVAFHKRQPGPLGLWLVGAVSVAFYWSRIEARRAAAGLAIGLFCGFLFFFLCVRRNGEEYMCVLVPVAALAFLPGIVALYRASRGAVRLAVVGLIVFGSANLVATWCLRLAVTAWQWDARSPALFARELQQHVPPNAKYVLACGEAWWTLARQGVSMRLYSHRLSEEERVLVRYDYVVVNEDDRPELWGRYTRSSDGVDHLVRDFELVGEIKRPLPRFALGGHRRSYSCSVYRRRPAPPVPGLDSPRPQTFTVPGDCTADDTLLALP